MPVWLHVLLCVLVPALWGVAMFYAFNAVNRRRAEAKPNDPPPIDYSI